MAAAVTFYTAFKVVADDLPPIPEPDRVARLYVVDPSAPMGRRPVRGSEIDKVLDRATDHLIVTTTARQSSTVDVDGCAVLAGPLVVRRVLPTFRDVVRVAPQLGRTWAATDAAESVALLSDRLWRRACAADAQVLGRVVRVDGSVPRVIGVMPDGFWFGDRDTDVWLVEPRSAAHSGIDVVARLTGSETWQQVNARFAGGQPADRPVAVPLTDPSVRRGAQALIGLLGPALLVLLTACGNASAVLVARTLGRERELAIRLSLGASPWRVARQSLAESSLVAVVSAVVALALAAGGVRILQAALAPLSPGAASLIALDARALAFAIAAAVASVGVTGIIPAIRAARTNIVSILPAAPGRPIWRAGAYGVTDLLVLVQMALAVVLVLVTLLFHSVLAEIVGSQLEGPLEQIAVMRLASATGSVVETNAARRVLDAVRDLPGVGVAALTDTRPTPGGLSAILRTDAADGSGYCRAVVRVVTPGYFDAVGLNLKGGRPFAAGQDAAVASATLARRCWGSGGAVGREVVVKIGSSIRRFDISGVVSDAGGSAKIADLQPADLYVPARGLSFGDSAYVLFRRQPGSARMDVDLRGLVERTSAGMLSLDESATLQEIVNRQTDAPAVLIGVFGAMAALALVLATMGISASVNQSAVRRRRSFAIRLALGAGPTSLAALAVGRDALLAAVGAGAGALITVAVTKSVWPDALFVAGTDWRFWLGACSALVGSGMLASFGPVWRTIRLDLMSILGRADT